MNRTQMYQLANDSVATMGSVISNVTAELDEILKQIENHKDKGTKITYLRKFIRTLKQKIKWKGFKPKLIKMLQEAYTIIRK